MKRTRIGRRAAAVLPACGLALALGACSDLLSVENPGAILDEQLNDPDLAESLVNSVVADFQRAYDELAYYSAVITDETVTGHNFETIKEIDLRLAKANNGTVNGDIYTPIQRARFAGDSISGRLRVIYGDSASSATGLATALAYGGYATLLLGEYICQAPVDPTSASLQWDALMQRAIGQFDEAIAIATAAKAPRAGEEEVDEDRVAAADSILNLARVGAGRAALNLGDMAAAIAYASAVPADFEAWVPHSIEQGYLENQFYGATNGNNQNLGVGPAFRGLDDPRVRFKSPGRTGHNGLTILFRPYQSLSFAGEIPTDTIPFERETPLRFASGLEAQYIVAEAQGATPATLAFVNERRAAAGQLPVALAGDALMAELRDQRRRDFFLDGHRLGDLRRYKKLYQIDLFPSGPHPNAEWGNYGTNECFLLPVEETTGNPASGSGAGSGTP